MIVVCGSARTGTSLVMQTLKLMGVPVAAPEFLPEHDSIREYNPNGFYELTSTIDGVKDSRYKGQAVKLFPNALKNTPKNLIKNTIRCKRNREDACISYAPLLEKIENTNFTAFEIYDANEQFLDNHLAGDNYLLITFEQFIESPMTEIERIVDYLDIMPSLGSVKAAYNNVNIIQKLK